MTTGEASPVVKRTREVRRRMAAECGNDIDRLVAAVRKAGREARGRHGHLAGRARKPAGVIGRGG